MIPPPIRTVGARDEVARAWDALHLQAHEKLKARVEAFEIPSIDRAPLQDIVLVYRLPNDYKSPSGKLILPEEFAEHHDLPYSIGVLLAAGPEAWDVLTSHGCLPGDLVTFAKYSGEEEASGRAQEAIEKATKQGHPPVLAAEAGKQASAAEMKKKKLLRFQVPFIHLSIDLAQRLWGERPTMELVRQVNAEGQVLHVYRPVIENLI